MADKLSHFALHADDVERAKKFYGTVFEWDFQAYAGADGFCQIVERDGKQEMGAIQSRKYNGLEKDVYGYECTITVQDVEATTRAVEDAGGTILMRKTAIPHVGWIIKFRDPEGNLACAITMDSAAA